MSSPAGTGPDLSAAEAALHRAHVLVYGKGRFAEALPHAEEAVALAEAALGTGSPRLLPALRTVLLIRSQTGDPAGAAAMARRVLALCEATLPAWHLEIVTSLENLGGLLQSLGRARESIPYLERAITLARETLPGFHPQRLNATLTYGMSCVQAPGDGAAAAAMQFVAVLGDTREAKTGFPLDARLVATGPPVAVMRPRGENGAVEEGLLWGQTGRLRDTGPAAAGDRERGPRAVPARRLKAVAIVLVDREPQQRVPDSERPRREIGPHRRVQRVPARQHEGLAC